MRIRSTPDRLTVSHIPWLRAALLGLATLALAGAATRNPPGPAALYAAAALIPLGALLHFVRRTALVLDAESGTVLVTERALLGGPETVHPLDALRAPHYHRPERGRPTAALDLAGHDRPVPLPRQLHPGDTANAVHDWLARHRGH